MKLFVLISTDYLICLLPSFTNIFHSQMNAVYMKKWITRWGISNTLYSHGGTAWRLKSLSPCSGLDTAYIQRYWINKANKNKPTKKNEKWKNRDIAKMNVIKTDIHRSNIITHPSHWCTLASVWLLQNSCPVWTRVRIGILSIRSYTLLIGASHVILKIHKVYPYTIYYWKG